MIRRLTDRTERADALQYLADRLGTTPRELVWTFPYEIVAAYRNEKIDGVLLFIDWRVLSVEVHLAGEIGWFNRRVITAMCRFAFGVLGANRLVGLIGADNITARIAAERTGFVLEGIAREAEVGGRDTAIYAMLKRECRWIRDEQGQTAEVRRRSRSRSADEGEHGRL